MKSPAEIPEGTPVLYPPRFGAFADDRPIPMDVMVGRANIIMAIFRGLWPSEN